MTDQPRSIAASDDALFLQMFRQLPDGRWVLRPENTVSSLIIILANKLTNNASRIYRHNFGLGTTEWRIMTLVAAEPWSTPQRICEVIGFDKAAVSRGVKVLETKKLVETRARRGRSYEIMLTQSGLAMHDQIAAVALERERRFITAISRAEMDELRKTLNALIDNMSAKEFSIEMDRYLRGEGEQSNGNEWSATLSRSIFPN